MKYIIDKRFKTSVERTPRVLEVAEGFGLGLSDKEFVVYNNLEIEVNQGDIVYVTGQSGSGKSLILNELARQMGEGGLKVADLNKITPADVPVIEQVGATTTQAADLLAKAGISDAYIYLRKPSELSDGQRYRLKLAILMGMDADIWVADEFGAVLDRVTAKCVAFNMQKVARALGKTLIVATTHTDLKEELGPSLTITKRFRQVVELDQAIASIVPPVETVPFECKAVVDIDAAGACPGGCIYSRAMSQPRPRLCVRCRNPERA